MFATTSSRRAPFSCRMLFGTGWMLTSATSASFTWPPFGESISRFWMSLTLWRIFGSPQTWVS